MNTHIDTRSQDLIDLGAVVEETKGSSNHDIQDDGQAGVNHKFPLTGMLTAD